MGAALRCYERLFTGSIRRQRMRTHRLLMLMEEMTKPELAHYYAGVQAHLKAQPAREWGWKMSDETKAKIGLANAVSRRSGYHLTDEHKRAISEGRRRAMAARS